MGGFGGKVYVSLVVLYSKPQASMNCSRGSYSVKQVDVVVVVVVVGIQASKHFWSSAAIHSVAFKVLLGSGSGRVTLPVHFV